MTTPEYVHQFFERWVRGGRRLDLSFDGFEYTLTLRDDAYPERVVATASDCTFADALFRLDAKLELV